MHVYIDWTWTNISVIICCDEGKSKKFFVHLYSGHCFIVATRNVPKVSEIFFTRLLEKSQKKVYTLKRKQTSQTTKWAFPLVFDASFAFILGALADAMKDIKHSRDVFATLTSQRTSTRVLRSYNVQVKHILVRKRRRKYVDERFEELSIHNTERLFGQSNEVPDDYLPLGYDSRTANQINRVNATINTTRCYIFRSHYNVYIYESCASHYLPVSDTSISPSTARANKFFSLAPRLLPLRIKRDCSKSHLCYFHRSAHLNEHRVKSKGSS